MQFGRFPFVVLRIFIAQLLFFPFPPLRAAYVPIALTADSYNEDGIVEKTAPPPLTSVTTASIDSGIANTGLTFYEKGYNANYPTTGLPAAGTIYPSESDSIHEFQFAPSYTANDALLIDSNMLAGTFSLSSPAAFSALSFLVCAGNGGGPLQYIVHYQNSLSQTGTVSCPDYFNGHNAACLAQGRVDVNTFVFNDVSSGTCSLFSKDINLAVTNSAVTSVDFNYAGGASHCFVFAISGAHSVGDNYEPVAISGYNADVIVEAGATRAGPLNGVTTATIEKGTMNGAHTFYERGYYPPAPSTGLPPAGTILTSAAAPDHAWLLAPDYRSNNAALTDATNPQSNLTPAVPGAFAGLSFLCAAGNGPVTNRCVVQHANGVSETNTIVVPDWLAQTPAAYSASGRVNMISRLIDLANSGNPKIFGIDIPLSVTNSAVTNIVLSFVSGAADSHSFFLAVSGGSQSVASPIPAVLTMRHNANGTLTLTTTQPGTLQITTNLSGPNTFWLPIGPLGASTNFTPGGGSSGAFYRVASP